MSRLDAIKARQEARERWNGSDGGQRTSDVSDLVAAVEAVLALHEPVRGADGSLCECFQCWDAYAVKPASWPCPTVAAIREALGEDA